MHPGRILDKAAFRTAMNAPTVAARLAALPSEARKATAIGYCVAVLETAVRTLASSSVLRVVRSTRPHLLLSAAHN